MAKVPSAHLPKKLLATEHRPKHAIAVSPLVIDCSARSVNGVYERLKSRAEGLTAGEAAARLLEHGPRATLRSWIRRKSRRAWPSSS